MSLEEKIVEAINKGYYVDTYGNIFSRTKKLSLATNSSGYYNFSVRINKIRYPIQVHQFVAYIKYGNKIFENGIEIRHFDGNQKNNSPINILIGTHTDNINDIPKKKRILGAIKQSSNIRRFSDEIVQQIINDRNSGSTYDDLCRKYNTSKSTLSYLFNNAYYSGMRNVEEI